MPEFDINKARASDMTNVVENYEVTPMQTDAAQNQEETEYINTKAPLFWGYFNKHPDLKSAILMKALWIVGKGYTTDNATRIRLEAIKGWGKDTFDDIMFNLEVNKRVFGDAFAEIVWDEVGNVRNLKVLDPQSIKIIVNRKGIIKRYEQINKVKDKNVVVQKWKPQDILHLCHNRLVDQIHGISDIESLEETIKAEEENFADMKTLMHRQARPFIIFKIKSDDDTKLSQLASKIDQAVNKGENMYIPDDENVLSYDVVQINPSSVILAWRDDVRNKFYRNVGLPQVVPGAGGNSTESESKVIYFAFEQIIEKDQRYLEQQLWAQLAIKLNFIPPQTLSTQLQTDERKDGTQGLNGGAFQPADTTAGAAT